MLFLTDPAKRPALWSKFAEKMVSGEIMFLVHRAEVICNANRQSILVEGPDQLIDSFRLADVVRFGANRGQAIGPFFALTLDGETAHLVEYAIDRSAESNARVAKQEDLQSLALNLFFESREIKKLSFPLTLSGWELNEWKAVLGEKETTLQRQSQ